MIQLEPFTEADIDRLIGWVPSLEDHLLWTASFFEYPLTPEPFRKLLRESAERGDRRLYKAVETATGKAVGHLELGAIDLLNRSTRIGRVLVAPGAQGRGIGTAMMRAALEIADHGYVLEAGRVVLEGPNSALRADDRVRQAYLGM